MMRTVQWPREWTLNGVKNGCSVTWNDWRDALHLDPRTAAVLKLGEAYLQWWKEPRHSWHQLKPAVTDVLKAEAADA